MLEINDPPCGRWVTREDGNLAEFVSIDNARLQAVRYPSLALVAECEDDVVFAIQTAQKLNIPFRVLGGGHSAEGYSIVPEGLVLVMHNFKKLELDEKSGQLTAGAGVIWNEVYSFLRQQQQHQPPFLAVGGGCPSVGLIGFLMGGGKSQLSRSLGLGSDNLISARIILADGEKLILNSTLNDDLFEAIRGGGGGNFGVVTEVVIQTHQLDSAVMELEWDGVNTSISALPNYGQFLELPQHSMVGAPAFLFKDYCPGCNVSFVAKLFATGNNSLEQVESAANDLVKLIGGDPIITYLGDYPTYVFNRESTADGVNWEFIQNGMYSSSTAFSPEVSETFVNGLATAPGSLSSVGFDDGGGVIASNKGVGSFVYRDYLTIYQVKAAWTSMWGAREANLEWSEQMRAVLYPPTHNQSYINYIDRRLPFWDIGYYGTGEIRQQLQLVQRKYDPNCFFHFEQSICNLP